MSLPIFNAGRENLQLFNLRRRDRGVELDRAYVVFAPDHVAPHADIRSQEKQIFTFRWEPIATKPHTRAGYIDQ
jgi:hypothetical protein